MARNRDRSHLANAYARIVAKEATQDSLEPSNQEVADLAQERAKRTLGVHVFQDERGNKRMVVRFQTEKTAPHEVNCSPWLDCGSLGEQLARAWYAQQGVKTSSSRISSLQNVLGHFFAHLKEYISTGHQLDKLADLTPEVLHSFSNYLDRQNTMKGKPLEERVKQRYYRDVRRLLEFMKITEPFKAMLPPLLPLKKIAYTSISYAANSTEALPDDIAARIDTACIKEMEEYMQRFRHGALWCQEYKESLPDKSQAKTTDFTSLGMIIAALYHQVGFPLPSNSQLKKDYPALWAAINLYCCAHPAKGQEHGRFCDGGYSTVLSYLCPTPRTIVPFIVMTGRSTYFNPSTLLGLEWKGIGENFLYGDEQMDIRVSIAGEKGRANKPQVRSFPKALKRIDNPAVILENIKLYASHIREHVPSELRDRVWQFTQIQGQSKTGGYLKGDSYSSPKNCDDFPRDIQWRGQFEAFKTENKLPDFSLRQLRATGSESVDRATGGDIKLQQIALQHSASGIVELHYNSGPAKQRRREKLAAFMQERERWISTGGKCDTRDGKGCGDAVTPGFHCGDIFASPLPGQKEGRMCTAYLSCPICPLAAVNGKDPKALAYLIRLDDAIEDAKDRVGPERWMYELAPILLRIRNTWLPAFTDSTVWDQAAEIIEQLPDIFVE